MAIIVTIPVVGKSKKAIHEFHVACSEIQDDPTVIATRAIITYKTKKTGVATCWAENRDGPFIGQNERTACTRIMTLLGRRGLC